MVLLRKSAVVEREEIVAGRVGLVLRKDHSWIRVASGFARDDDRLVKVVSGMLEWIDGPKAQRADITPRGQIVRVCSWWFPDEREKESVQGD